MPPNETFGRKNWSVKGLINWEKGAKNWRKLALKLIEFNT